MLSTRHVFWMIVLSSAWGFQTQADNHVLVQKNAAAKDDSIHTAMPSGISSCMLYVDASATGSNTGTSWNNAFVNLQDALAAVDSMCAPAQIWVADGTYMPDGGRTPKDSAHVNGSGNRSASFMLHNNVSIYGGFSGNETQFEDRNPATHLTILSGDLAANDDGSNNNLENAYHVVFADINVDTSAILDGFTIEAGYADEGSGPNGLGGGLYAALGSPSIINCTFTHNKAYHEGGGMISYASPRLINCRFINNEVGKMSLNGFGWGGGAAVQSAGEPYTFFADPTFINCSFSDNTATGVGGAIFSFAHFPSFINCTIVGNTVLGTGNAGTDTQPGNGGGIWTTGSPTLQNVILWGNSAVHDGPQFYASGASVTMTYCDIQGGFDGGHSPAPPTVVENNIDADPLLVNIPGGNFHLQSTSPCIDAGDPAFVVAPDAETDMDGNARIISCRVDIGADEWFTEETINKGDLDGNHTVDLADVPIFVDALANGPNAFQICIADMNNDGKLNGLDIQLFLDALI